MIRRDFLSRGAVFVAAAAGVDHLDLLAELVRRRLFGTGHSGVSVLAGDGVTDDTHAFQALLDGGQVYDLRRKSLRIGTDFDTDIFCFDGTPTARSRPAVRNDLQEFFAHSEARRRRRDCRLVVTS
jgi:hypothetical protein